MEPPERFSPDEAVRGYLPLMHELATRMDLVAAACEGRLNLSAPYAREVAFLQFRRMCELIALGCLQLHGDLPHTQTQSAKKEWHAERIMQMLHKDYPHAFPQAATRTKTADGWRIQANSKPGALTRAEFKELYSECGEVLHRGTIRSLQTAGPLSERDYQRVLDWQRKLVDLMNEHVIGRANGAGFYVVTLRTTSGYPECSICSPDGASGLKVAIRRMEVVDAPHDRRPGLGEA